MTLQSPAVDEDQVIACNMEENWYCSVMNGPECVGVCSPVSWPSVLVVSRVKESKAYLCRVNRQSHDKDPPFLFLLLVHILSGSA
mmetsp:Transcript_21980/g.39911  ORF Transcript_21980/g.39911 Transcript_21980/m.39911 type:complete len:85 (-) Transcript_21980:324-578(-)